MLEKTLQKKSPGACRIEQQHRDILPMATVNARYLQKSDQLQIIFLLAVPKN